MGGRFWSFRPQFKFMCSKLPGILDAYNNDRIPTYTREVQVEYFKLFPSDLKLVKDNKYYPGEEERMEVSVWRMIYEYKINIDS